MRRHLAQARQAVSGVHARLDGDYVVIDIAVRQLQHLQVCEENALFCLCRSRLLIM